MLITFITVISWIYSVWIILRFTITEYDVQQFNKKHPNIPCSNGMKPYEYILGLLSITFLVTKYFV
jgi:hypothetical protein